MKANEFINKYGIDVAKNSLSKSEIESDFNNELKRLIESHYLVRDLGGVKVAKEMYEIIKTCRSGDKLKQAIADVESCQ